MIAVLMEKNPSAFVLPSMRFNTPPPSIPNRVPDAVLARRPDVAEQQRKMESIHALLGVAYAEYFPKIDLNAGVGWMSPLTKYFLKGLSRF